MLLGDTVSVLLLPFPDCFDKMFTAQVVASQALRCQVALDHVLRGDARVVDAGDLNILAANWRQGAGDLSVQAAAVDTPSSPILLGDANGDAPGGFLEIDADFKVVGRWEKSLEGMNYNYDFWYQPRHNVMISSEWAAPNTVKQGFQVEDVKAGKYGHHLNFWDWSKRRIMQSIDLGEEGMIPLEVRFHHNPESPS